MIGDGQELTFQSHICFSTSRRSTILLACNRRHAMMAAEQGVSGSNCVAGAFKSIRRCSATKTNELCRTARDIDSTDRRGDRNWARRASTNALVPGALLNSVTSEMLQLNVASCVRPGGRWKGDYDSRPEVRRGSVGETPKPVARV